MGPVSRFDKAILLITAGFLLFVGGWFLGSKSHAQPYQVIASRNDREDGGVTAVPDGGRPDSLLPGERIDINTADGYDLQRLPGIGESRAEEILKDRQDHGPFLTVDDLDRVPGIGPGIVEGLREYAVAGGGME